jgi:hypothetical protein
LRREVEERDKDQEKAPEKAPEKDPKRPKKTQKDQKLRRLEQDSDGDREKRVETGNRRERE